MGAKRIGDSGGETSGSSASSKGGYSLSVVFFFFTRFRIERTEGRGVLDEGSDCMFSIIIQVGEEFDTSIRRSSKR